MSQFTKRIFKILLIVMLTFSVTANNIGFTTCITAEAAVKTPLVKESKKTIYTGNNTYQIELINIANSAKVTYKSSNSKIATVSKKGKVTPVAEGKAIITVSVKQNKKTFDLKVTILVNQPSLNFTESTDYLNVSETFQFKAVTVGMKARVTWSVSDEAVATINSEGKLTAVKDGTVTVYASAGDKTAKSEVIIGTNRIGTFSRNINLYNETTIWISTADFIEDEELTVSTGKEDTVDCIWGNEWVGDNTTLTLKPIGTGRDTITITSNKTNDRLIIDVNILTYDKKRTELSAKEIYAKCGSSTVEIVASDDFNEGLGSGFFVDNGRVVTNYHVIKGAKKIIVKTKDKYEYEVKNILGYNEALDLAVLEIVSENDSLVLSQLEPVVGEEIYALGSPLGLTQTLTDGIVSTSSRIIDKVDYIQISAPISPGNSGGPLLNAYGEVIGINTMYFENGQNLNFAINIKELQKINTNRPISVADFYAKFVIYEDPINSQHVNTSQYVPSGSRVQGSVTANEKFDCFRFHVTNANSFFGIIYSENLPDLENTYFSLYDIDGNFIKLCSVNEEKLYQYIQEDLYPGDYVIFIDLPKNYTGPDVKYNFFLYYD